MKNLYCLIIVLTLEIMFPKILLSFDKIVYDVQFFLQLHGYNPGVIDGVIGPSTRKAIINFKNEHGQLENDKIDANLKNALGLSDHGNAPIPEYPAGENKNLLVSDKEQYKMKLAKNLIGKEDENGYAKIPGFGQLKTTSGWVVSAGYATHVSNEEITVNLYNKNEFFYKNDTTILCHAKNSQNISDIKFGDSITVFTKPDSTHAISICVDQFYIIINLNNPSDIDIDLKKFSCGKVLK